MFSKAMSSLRRTGVLVGIALSLLFPSTAHGAAQQYADLWWYWPDQGAGSSFSSGWRHNWFLKDYSGYLTTVTFIDNSGYDWHVTVRNSFKTTATAWQSSAVKKAHCRSNTALEFSGSCVVATN
jgi:hypothetical protein